MNYGMMIANTIEQITQTCLLSARFFITLFYLASDKKIYIIQKLAFYWNRLNYSG